MAEANVGLDSLALFLSGGADNYDPSASLGGQISTKLVKGLSPIYSEAVQGLIIEDASPACGEGEATIIIHGDEATFTPPDGLAGSAVEIAEGETKILLGSDTSKAVRISRVSGEIFAGAAEFELVKTLNGVFSMPNVPDADRQSGSVIYRALFVKALAAVEDVLAWITTDGQSTFQLALETPDSVDTIQEISDEQVAPAGLDWVSAVSEETALDLDDSTGLLEDETVGVWIKRTFPSSGVVALEETVNFFIKFTET